MLLPHNRIKGLGAVFTGRNNKFFHGNEGLQGREKRWDLGIASVALTQCCSGFPCRVTANRFILAVTEKTPTSQELFGGNI